MDIEDYYFEDAKIPYSKSRTRKEVLQLMEQRFFESVVTKTMKKTDEWVKCLPCPIIYADGTKSIDEIMGLLLTKLESLQRGNCNGTK